MPLTGSRSWACPLSCRCLEPTAASQRPETFENRSMQTEKHMRVRRAYTLRITASPETASQDTESVKLEVTGLGGLSNGKQSKFEWECIEEDCKGKGKCNDKTTDKTCLIEKDSLPNPFEHFFCEETDWQWEMG
nr:uncharacterized protein LOC115112245 isoform X1 [Oncorhynchus nerka]